MRSLVQLLLTVLLNASWQIAVVTVFAACCSRLLRGTAAWCRHSVWVAAIVISLCLPIISGLNAFAFSSVPEQKVTRIEPEQSLAGQASSIEFDLNESAITPDRMPIVEPVRQTGWGSPISLNRNLAGVLLLVYISFLLFRGFKLLRAWRKTRAIMRSAYSTRMPEAAAAIIAKCQTAIGVTRVRVVCSTSVPVPVTAGVFNPLIILPAQLLSEADEEVLLSAIGHELVHVARRDYILNLVYELIYLPLSFHPAAAVLRRRIKQTRELCCDELVARKLLAPDVYARSLVRLVGSVPLTRRWSPDTTIGITDADILEVRIMSLLKTSKLSTRRKTLSLIAACLLLAVPCVAAAAFGVQFEISTPQPAISQLKEPGQEASQKIERAREDLQRAREELQRKERELAERVRKNSNPQGEELEALRRMQTELREASVRLNREQESQHLKAAEDGLRQLQERMAQIARTYPADEARMREAKEKLAELQRSLPESLERSRELREQLAMIEKQYPNAAQMAEGLESLRRAQEEFAQQKENLEREQREKIEEKLKHERRVEDVKQHYREALEKKLIEDREGKNKIRSKEYEKLIRKEMDKRRKELDEAARKGGGEYEKQIRKEMDKRRKELDAAARERGGKEQAELTQLATVPMDRAIQIAVSQHPGKVVSCNLGRQKDGQAFYRLVIMTGAGDKSSATHVWVSATDGRIIKTEHE